MQHTFLSLFRLSTLVVMLLAAAAPLRAQNAQEVLRNLQQEFDNVNDYRADISATVLMPNLNVPPMKATVYYKKPDKVHIASSGFAMLPRDAVMFNPRMLGEDLYDAVVQGTELVDGAPCIKLKLLAKSDTLRLQRMMLYVDPTRWLILRMATDPAQGNSADARFTYLKVDGRWWLPSRIQLQMTLPAGSRPRSMPKEKLKETASTQSTVTIVYSNYRVNKGISDAVFHQK